ncbi:potassium transporter TrkG, partial [Streptomyces sp. MAR4 CNY-716]
MLLEVLRYRNRRRVSGRHTWSLHAKLTLTTTAVLLAAGMALTCALEWSNGATLGPLGAGGKPLSGFFHSAMTRTAGFNAVAIDGLHPATLLVTCALMFIGGGSAGTA